MHSALTMYMYVFHANKASLNGIDIHSMRHKTDRGVARDVLDLAAKDVERGISIRGAAKSFSISHVMLFVSHNM